MRKKIRKSTVPGSISTKANVILQNSMFVNKFAVFEIQHFSTHEHWLSPSGQNFAQSHFKIKLFQVHCKVRVNADKLLSKHISSFFDFEMDKSAINHVI